MNIFTPTAFKRLQGFIRKSEAGLVEAKVRQAYQPNPVRWQWYEVVESGPSSEADYTDERYWLKRAELTNSDSDATSSLSESAIEDTDDRFKHITATNIAEWLTGSHTVEAGTLVQVRVAYGPQSIETPRFWFVSGTGTELLYYVGGYFSAAGSVRCSALAIEHNGTWNTFESHPTVQGQSEVRQLLVWNDDLYGLGSFKFNIVDDVTYDETFFAKWNATSEEWEEVASSSTALGLSSVYCMIEYGGNIVIGGSGSTTAARVFNGSGFSDLGSSGSYLDAIYCMLEWDGDLYAGGSATGTAKGLAVLSGTAWSQVSGGTNGNVYAIAAHDDGSGEQLYFGGGYTQANSVSRRNIARWDGSAMSSVWQRTASLAGFASSSSDSVRAMASFGGKLWMGGQSLSPGPTLAIFDGQRIDAAPCDPVHHSTGGSAATAVVNALTVYVDPDTSKSTLLAGGEFYYVRQKTTGEYIPFSGRYDAFEGKWTTVSSSDLDDSVYEQVDYDGVLYALGLFKFAGNTACEYFAKLTGGAFTQAGQVNGPCYAGAAFNDGSDDILLVGGNFDQINGSDAASSIFRLNGTTLDAPFDVELAGGPGIVNRIKGAYLCGKFDTVDGVTTSGIAEMAWSGGSVTITALVDSLTGNDARIYDCCSDGTYLYVAGSFTSIGNSATMGSPVSASNVARMLLSTGVWSAMGSGASADAYCCDIYDSQFTFGFNAAPYLRTWNGSSYDLVLDSASHAGPPYSTSNSRAPQMVKVIGSDLYVDFNGGTTPRTRLAKLVPAAEWIALGSGNPVSETSGIFDRPIRSVIEFDSGSGTQYHIGGDFTQIGADEGEQVLPRNCLCKITRAGYSQPFLGGVGSKNNSASTSGESTRVYCVDVLTDVPGLSGQSIGVGGSLDFANHVTCNGIAAVSSRRNFLPVGIGVRYRSAGGVKNFVGVSDVLLGSDGWHYFAGPFDEGMNALEGSANFPETVASTGVIAHDGTEFIAIKATAIETVSNSGETHTDEEVTTATTFAATQFTPASGAWNLSSVTLRVENTAMSSGRIVAMLYSDSSGSPGSVLQTFNNSVTVASGATVDATFSADYDLSGSTPYWIVLKTDNTTVKWHMTSSTSETSGSGWTIGDDSKISTDSGGSWSSGLGYCGLMELTATSPDDPITRGYCLAENGVDGNGDPKIMLGHNDGIHIWNWETEAWTDIFTNIDTGTIQPIWYRFAKLGTDWYICGQCQIDTIGDAYLLKFDGTDEWNKVTLPTDVLTVEDMVVGDIGNGTRIYVCCTVSTTQQTVYEYDGSTFTEVGPTGAGAGAIYGTTSGIAICDVGDGPTLVVVGGEINSVGYVACVYDVGDDEWYGIGQSGLVGILEGAQAVRDGALLVFSGARLPDLAPENPSTGDTIIDSMAEWNIADGWRRVNGTYGANEFVEIAGD